MTRPPKMMTLVAAVLAASAATLPFAALAGEDERGHYKHVLLISVDGLHEVDLVNYAASHPTSAMAGLLEHGVHYTNASTATPSDSFPGLTALVTGATPKSSGVYYDDSYDRSLSPPKDSKCGTIGTETVYAENLDTSFDDGLGGATKLTNTIDRDRLPRDPRNGANPASPATAATSSIRINSYGSTPSSTSRIRQAFTQPGPTSTPRTRSCAAARTPARRTCTHQKSTRPHASSRAWRLRVRPATPTPV